ncbi:MAG: putative spermidine/putrescine transport system permease protein, partial [Subtercola sp.]|nr:putative spermidine/putrescine transport system permease protein [Subtercola sp.]
MTKKLAVLGLTPFAVYVLLFLGVPSVLAITTGFFGKSGAFTLDNIGALFS